MRLMRVCALLFLAGLLLSGVFAVSAEAKTKEYKTALSIRYGVGVAQGFIESSADECFDNRKVDVFTDGAFVGRATSDDLGYWFLRTEQGSRYTAKIDTFTFKKTSKTKYVCKSAVARIP